MRVCEEVEGPVRTATTEPPSPLPPLPRDSTSKYKRITPFQNGHTHIIIIIDVIIIIVVAPTCCSLCFLLCFLMTDVYSFMESADKRKGKKNLYNRVLVNFICLRGEEKKVPIYINADMIFLHVFE